MKKMKREDHLQKVIKSNIKMDNYQQKNQEQEKFKIA